VNQGAIAQAKDASTFNYCVNMYKSTFRIFLDSVYTKQAESPTPDAANLFAFLAQRFNAAVGILGCPDLLGIPSPLEIFVAPASDEHLAKYPREVLARYKSLIVVATDATFSQSVLDKIETLQTVEDTSAMAVGESVIPAAATVPESFLVPLIAVSAVLGAALATGTTVVIVKKVRERRSKKEIAAEASMHGSKRLSINTGITPTNTNTNYVTDISAGYPVSPHSPRPNSPSPKDRITQQV